MRTSLHRNSTELSGPNRSAKMKASPSAEIARKAWRSAMLMAMAARTLLDGLDGGIWRNRITHTQVGDRYVGIDAGETIQLSTGEAANAAMGELSGNCTVDAADYFQSHTLPHADGLLLDVVIAPSIRTADASNLVIVVLRRAPAGERLLPYIEQDNLYTVDGKSAGIASVVDGTSNTMMFGERAGFVAAPYVDLRGTLTGSPGFRDIENALSIDVWEHAYSAQHAFAGGTTTAFPDVAKQIGSAQPGEIHERNHRDSDRFNGGSDQSKCPVCSR